jgi:hypothetical protein
VRLDVEDDHLPLRKRPNWKRSIIWAPAEFRPRRAADDRPHLQASPAAVVDRLGRTKLEARSVSWYSGSHSVPYRGFRSEVTRVPSVMGLLMAIYVLHYYARTGPFGGFAPPGDTGLEKPMRCT